MKKKKSKKKSIRFIGDIHGNADIYRKLIKNRNTIQVGDLGAGFFDITEFNNPKNIFIRGNHDDPEICKAHPCWIPDGATMGKVMFIGGGYSIDHVFRTPYIDWWPDEELSDEEFSKIMQVYLKNKPEIMITHECPFKVADMIFGPCKFSMPGMSLPDRTSQWLQLLWEHHKPKYWIFGHFHDRKDVMIDTTRFICLEEFGVLDVQLEV